MGGPQENYLFVPLAVETTGCWCSETKLLFKDVRRRLRERGLDTRSGSFLVQRLTIAIQRGNASVMPTFARGMMLAGYLFRYKNHAEIRQHVKRAYFGHCYSGDSCHGLWRRSMRSITWRM